MPIFNTDVNYALDIVLSAAEEAQAKLVSGENSEFAIDNNQFSLPPEIAIGMLISMKEFLEKQ